ncbi:putative motility protein [Paenibacillus mesophilus]|uniref:YjfB family protein n=1 Tax=Paenibacillus mesophilus TaxID=2582849 RepID=UPI00110F4538|nr:YjfB family protein [Paenibacillus mesophilus]TMV45838.1 putative motility protein [Paenibacillus mesophilus]
MSVSLNAAYSQFSKSDLPLAVGIQMLSKVKEAAEVQGAQMAQMLQQSVQPHLGGSLDIRA